MEAKQPRTPPSRHASEPARHDDPPERRQRRTPTRDKWFEYSFYVAALALIALMEWYSRLREQPRMLWAYLVLAAVAGGYAASRLRPLRARLRHLRKCAARPSR